MMNVQSAINALCPNCNQIKKVEACIHCYQPLCSDCIGHHVDQWRLNSIKYCETIDKKVDKYLTRIGLNSILTNINKFLFSNIIIFFFFTKETLNPLINQNKDNIQKAKIQIQDLFQSIISKLEDQKSDLFNKLDDIDKIR